MTFRKTTNTKYILPNNYYSMHASIERAFLTIYKRRPPIFGHCQKMFWWFKWVCGGSSVWLHNTSTTHTWAKTAGQY